MTKGSKWKETKWRASFLFPRSAIEGVSDPAAFLPQMGHHLTRRMRALVSGTASHPAPTTQHTTIACLTDPPLRSFTYEEDQSVDCQWRVAVAGGVQQRARSPVPTATMLGWKSSGVLLTRQPSEVR